MDKKLKERFVNEKLLLQGLPVFLCGCKKKSEKQLDAIIDMTEEHLILEKATELRLENLEEASQLNAVSEALRTLRIARKLGIIKRGPFPVEEQAKEQLENNSE